MDNADLFQAAWKFTVGAEGYGEVSNDQGGLTKYGISQKAFPDVDIANLTQEKAEELALEKYWNPSHCQYMILRPKLAIAHFDFSYNSGYTTALLTLQRCLGGIEVDAKWGPITEKAFLVADPVSLLASYIQKRREFLIHLADMYPEDSVDEEGWSNRIDHLVKYLQSFPDTENL